MTATSHHPRTRALARSLVAGTAALLLAAPGAALAAPGGAPGAPDQHPRDAAITERQALPADDGWAAAEGGTTGGSAATAEHLPDVSNRTELVAALEASGEEPSIIRVHGEIPLNADAEGNPITCEEIAEGTGYTLEGYLEAFDPATWGTAQPEGPMEEARERAADKQKQLITLSIPSNTTLIGAEEGAGLTGARLSVSGVDNVIVRNLVFADTADCFPSWDPTDGADGAWNSEYDSIQVIGGTTHVWIDHNTFTDEPMTDDTLPKHFGQTFQRHDGAVDITNGSDLVTLSWNQFTAHDKLSLIGSTDSEDRGDPGRLRVTLHHNLYEGVGQRAPRVRWGQVDVYNNHFVISDDQTVDYGYSFGVGKESHLWAEANSFTVTGDVEPAQFISHLRGEVIRTEGNLVNQREVDLLAAYNAEAPADEQLGTDTSWEPTLRECVHKAEVVGGVVDAWSGPQHGPAPGRLNAAGDC
ncbi:polysaccharide lyase family 1 protein [Brachybacterium sp. YJGR34]|uniref:pectate lyase family protein n=1 Tax=Brachybacterium sp. YJGR34 TaxID=2059911 RepID=UPI000E0AA215|nr:pectate lyase [Brachybacterium sp. YJGR34]